MTHVIVVDDDPALGALVRAALTSRGCSVALFERADEAFEAAMAGAVDVVVTDLQLAGMSGVDLCERLAANRPDVPVVVMTAYGNLDSAIAAIRAGAYDYLTKPLDTRQIAMTVERAAGMKSLREEVRRLREATGEDRAARGLIGESPPMRRVLELAARVAPTEASVLVTGETGTGKELVARALHEGSPRKEGPFVAVNCAAIPETLLESELFGHARGAFTDAKASRNGLFVDANGGTLFLDEVAELPLSLQPKLLRALQERQVRPVGGRTEVPIDVRIVAATNRDLLASAEAGEFRSDLFYRLNVITIDIPPLRARGNDILLLAQHFARSFAGSSGKQIDGLLSATAEKLLEYDWPGNVRELQNCIERAVTLTRFDRIAVEDLPEQVRRYRRASVPAAGSGNDGLLTLDAVERRHIRHVLEAMGGNKTLAARVLGVDRTTLHRKLASMSSSRDGQKERALEED